MLWVSYRICLQLCNNQYGTYVGGYVVSSAACGSLAHHLQCQSWWYGIYLFHSASLKSRLGPLSKPVPHVPDISHFDGLQDLFSVLNLIELSNILHFATYLSDGLPASERKQMIHGRLKAREITAWVIQNYRFEDSYDIEHFYWSYLAYQARALYESMVFTESRGITSWVERKIAADMKELISVSFEGMEQFWRYWEEHQGVETFAWPPNQRHVVCVKEADERLAGNG
jgi:hypothetical protein